MPPASPVRTACSWPRSPTWTVSGSDTMLTGAPDAGAAADGEPERGGRAAPARAPVGSGASARRYPTRRRGGTDTTRLVPGDVRAAVAGGHGDAVLPRPAQPRHGEAVARVRGQVGEPARAGSSARCRRRSSRCSAARPFGTVGRTLPATVAVRRSRGRRPGRSVTPAPTASAEWAVSTTLWARTGVRVCDLEARRDEQRAGVEDEAAGGVGARRARRRRTACRRGTRRAGARPVMPPTPQPLDLAADDQPASPAHRRRPQRRASRRWAPAAW